MSRHLFDSPRVFVYVLLGLCGWISTAHAQTTYDWTPLLADFGQSFNWTPAGGPPGELDTARFGGLTDTVRFSISPTNEAFLVQSGDFRFVPAFFPGETYTLTGDSSVSGGSLTIDPIGFLGLNLSVGNLDGIGGGSVTVNRGRWTQRGDLHMGDGSGEGSMVIDGTSTVFDSTFPGGSEIGFTGFGSFTVRKGARAGFAGANLRIGGGSSPGGISQGGVQG